MEFFPTKTESCELSNLILRIVASILVGEVWGNTISHKVPMIGFEVLIEINPTKRTEFFQAFEMIKSNEPHKAERLEISLFEQVNSSNTFLWKEYWQSHESTKQYFQSNTFRMMLGATKVLGRIVHKRVIRIEEE